MSAPKKHRFADIMVSGFPIVNIGKLIGMRPSARSPFGQRLFDARKGARLTQEQAAKALCISQGTLSELEKSAHGSAHTVSLANLYGVDANWLATGDESNINGRERAVSQPTPPQQWLFPRLPLDQLAVLTERELGVIEDAAARALDDVLARRAEGAQRKQVNSR